MDGARLRMGHGARLIHGIADHVDDPAERAVAHGNLDRCPGVGHFLPAHEPLARIHCNGAHRRFPEMLGNFQHEAVAVIARLQRVEDGGELTFKLHVDDGADHLGDMSDSIGHGYSFFTSVELVLLVSIHVMRGLLPRIHVFPAGAKAWMAGTSPAMTAHRASAPEMISISSLVIIAWRVRL